MPRFYFDTDDGVVHHRDSDGQELVDVESARMAAVDALVDMAGHGLADVDRRALVTTVRDERGATAVRAELILTRRSRSERTSLQEHSEALSKDELR